VKRAEPLRVLFIEDRPDDTELLLLELRRAGYLVESERVETRGEMAAALDRGGWEAVISDYRLPSFSGPAALALCQERGLDVPFIIVSGTVQEEDAVGALKAGAHDFVTKGNLARLAPALSRELRDAAERRGRRLAEQALQVTERQYRQLVESVRAVVWRCQAETQQLTFVNAEAELILGFPRRQWLEPGFWEQRHHPEDLSRATESRRLALRHGGGQLEYRMHAADGHVIWFQEFLSTIPGRSGTTELAGVAVDVSERKKLEEQLQRGQRLEALGRLAGGIAHDFNNVVGVIMGYADLALRDLPGEHRARPRVVQVQAAAGRAANLTRQLLAFSRRQALQPQPMELNQVVNGLRDMLQRVIGEDIELRLVLLPQLWPVCADPGQLEQVLLNLVLNARDAMPGGGLLAIETGNVTMDEVYVRSQGLGRPGDHVVLSVTDTGQGMDAETQRHVFEPFFTTKGPGEGTGLGLAVVYGIVEQSGGHVSVYSELGHGTTFKVYLPRAVGEVEPAAPPAREPAVARGQETVLLVEDETTLRSLIAEVLGSAGYQVLEARQGAEAVRIAESHDGPIHLLLTDVVMPGANGREVVRMVRARRPDTRFFYISGHPRDVFDQQGALGPGQVLLQKPFTADALLRVVRDVLDAVAESEAGPASPGCP
jgi:two-component system, cell cycle sensor histidine kinase and response regulator CckA